MRERGSVEVLIIAQVSSRTHPRIGHVEIFGRERRHRRRATSRLVEVPHRRQITIGLRGGTMPDLLSLAHAGKF